ncbi:hypothetical protein VIMY103929_10435 [Vibrio mytili]
MGSELLKTYKRVGADNTPYLGTVCIYGCDVKVLICFYS